MGLERLKGFEFILTDSIGVLKSGLDLFQALIELAGKFVAGEGLVAAILVVVGQEAVVGLGQGLEGLVGPVGGLDVGELVDVGNLPGEGLGGGGEGWGEGKRGDEGGKNCQIFHGGIK